MKKSFKKLFRTKRFLNHIYLWITLAFVMLMLIFSSIVYYNSERIVLENVYITNNKILSQLKYNIDYLDETIKSLCRYLFLNKDVKFIMYSHSNNNDTDFAGIVTRINDIEPVVSTNPYILSLFIYNNCNQTYYSTYGSLFYNDKVLKEDLSLNKDIPKLMPVLRKMEVYEKGEKRYKNVFSYFLYDSLGSNNLPDGAVVLNVKTEVFLDNINSEDNKRGNDKIFILNAQGEFIDNNSQDQSAKSYLKSIFDDFKSHNYYSEDKKGFLIKRIDGKDYIITFLYVEKVNLVLAKMQLSDDVFEYISKIRTSIMAITMIFLFVTVIVSISVSRRIYRPIDNLVKHVSNGGLKKIGVNKVKDEISYLNEIYTFSTKRLNEYEKEWISYRVVMKAFYLKKLLTDASSLLKPEFVKLLQESNINFKLDGAFALCIVRIDNYKDFEIKNKEEDRKLFKFAIINISSEVVSSIFTVEGVDMDDDKMVLILNTGGMYDTDEKYYNSLMGLVKQIQEHIMNYFSISVSFAISERIADVRELPGLYSRTLNNSMYRYIYGKMSIIIPSMVSANNQNRSYKRIFTYEKKLEEGIKVGNMQKIEELLQKIVKEITVYNYNNIIIAMIHLVDTIKNITEEINMVSLEPTYPDFTSVSQKFFDLETIDELYHILIGYLKEIVDKKEGNIIAEKHETLIENIKDIINKNYFKRSLCTDEIASMLKISSRYMGKIFKENTQISITEYINEVRLKKTTEWLEKSQLSISEILAKVGIENETYFYTLFKKRYGITPKEYAMQNSLKQV